MADTGACGDPEPDPTGKSAARMGSKRRVPAKLAKLERPRTEGLYERGRLFAMLDRARGKPVIWISAPPGAGKTSLVASYVRARDLARDLVSGRRRRRGHLHILSLPRSGGSAGRGAQEDDLAAVLSRVPARSQRLCARVLPGAVRTHAAPGGGSPGQLSGGLGRAPVPRRHPRGDRADPRRRQPDRQRPHRAAEPAFPPRDQRRWWPCSHGRSSGSLSRRPEASARSTRSPTSGWCASCMSARTVGWRGSP